MPLQSAGPVVVAALAIGVLLAGALAARILSEWVDWGPAGPIALIAAAPLLPHVPLAQSLSADDLLPLLGLGLLVRSQPVPRLTGSRTLRWLLAAVAVATVARVGTALVNGDGLDGTFNMLAQAIGRPVVLIGIACYVAVAAPERLRHRFVAISVAAVGTFEATFGLLAFILRLPSHVGMEAARQATSLYGVCPGRITGTLGLSANHLGAVFVLSVPVTLGLAVTRAGWRRWAWAAAAAVQCAALILTFTRSSILIGVVLSIGYLVYQRRFIMLAAVSAIAAGILASAFTISCTSAPIGERFAEGNDRLALWYAAGMIMVEHPLFGIGLDRMSVEVKTHPERYRETPFGLATSSAHNTILLAGAETGIPGGLAVLGINAGLAVVAVRVAWRARRREDALIFAAALTLGGYLVQGMVNNLFSVPATSVVFALLIGAVVGSHPQDDGRRNPDQLSAGAPAAGPYTSPASDNHGPDGDR